MELSDHLANALCEERIANSKRLNLLRFGGVFCFFATSIGISLFFGEEAWNSSSLAIGIYTLIAGLLIVGGRFSHRILALSRIAVPAFDMPMVFVIQMLHIEAARLSGGDGRLYSEFSVALYVCLLMLSAYTMKPISPIPGWSP